MPKKAPITASAQRLVWQRKVDDIGDRIKQKLEVMSGFKDVGGQLKKMQDFFLFFDKTGSGYLNFAQMCTALKKLNFLGCSRELEAFFNYYDDDCTGTVNYIQMSKEIYGMAGDGRPLFDFMSTGILEKVRSSVVDVGGAAGFFHISKRIRANTTTDGKISRMGLQDCLQEYGVGPGAVTTSELTLLCNAFDPLHKGLIDSAHFLQSLIKGTMSYERKLIVRQTFMRFNGAQEMGYVSVNDLVEHFDPSYHPEVIAELLGAEDARVQFRQSFSQGEESEGYVTLAEYLDYFKGVSLAVTNDHAFDMMMRNIIMFHSEGSPGGFDKSMSTSFSSPTLRRLLVTHSNGSQEVVEVLDEMGMGRFDVSSAKDKAREQGVTDIAAIKL